MAYVPIPKDLSNVKTKVVLNLTKRQLICFSAALAVGLPPFFILKDFIGTSPAVLVMMMLMFPLFMFAMLLFGVLQAPNFSHFKQIKRRY